MTVAQGNQPASAFGGDEKGAIGCGEKRSDAAPRKLRAILRGENFEPDAIEAGQASKCADPDIAVAGLSQSRDGEMGQAVGHGPALEHKLDLFLWPS